MPIALMSAAIHIGTSGWQYRHWSGKFYPEKTSPAKMFEQYIKHFDTVELNNSFYHLPPHERFEGWKKKSPPRFRFAVKGSKFITHNKKLHEAEEPLELFIENAKGLGRKLGPILFQTPPSWKINLERLESFLKLLPKRLRFTFEFRNPTWMTEEVFEMLKQYNAAFCIYELDRFEAPHIVTADTIYIRLHGPDGKYRGSYSNNQLRNWAEEIKEWSNTAKHIYVYFDNDQEANAPKNALTLKSMLDL
ncbi:MAG TPA: DUF72 domain-containing protein [Candidatus Kapabacteria bacterium]|jgi:uncharacterized protein YecE (DUF72 family)